VLLGREGHDDGDICCVAIAFGGFAHIAAATRVCSGCIRALVPSFTLESVVPQCSRGGVGESQEGGGYLESRAPRAFRKQIFNNARETRIFADENPPQPLARPDGRSGVI
jgi:hypothetical protein